MNVFFSGFELGKIEKWFKYVTGRQATMLKKLKGKMKRRNTEPTMSAGSNVAGHQMTLVTPVEPDELDQNNTDFWIWYNERLI